MRANRYADALDNAAFRRWFGDSRVVDKQGEPLVVWHGHPGNIPDFFVFDPSQVIDLGFHFGSRSIASEFGTPRPFYLSIQHPLLLNDPGDWIDRDGTLKQISYDPKGELRQPWMLVTAEEGKQARQYIAELKAEWKAKQTGRPQTDPAFRHYRAIASGVLRSLIEHAGYDGVVYTNKVEGSAPTTSWVAFHSSQIKSATDNIGTFDPKNPDIRKNGRSRSSRRRSSRKR